MLPASRSHDDLFIYLGRSAAAHTEVGLRMVELQSNGSRTAVESQSNRTCN